MKQRNKIVRKCERAALEDDHVGGVDVLRNWTQQDTGAGKCRTYDVRQTSDRGIHVCSQQYRTDLHGISECADKNHPNLTLVLPFLNPGTGGNEGSHPVGL